MELVRLTAPLAKRDALVAAPPSTTLFQCRDADTVIVVASLAGRLSGEVGVWIEVGDSYSAQLCARDLKTLSHLVALRHAVIEASSRSFAHAEVVRALLSDDEVDFTNEVATIRGAYDRPAPPRPVTVWSFDDGRLTSELGSLSARRSESREGVELTYFSD